MRYQQPARRMAELLLLTALVVALILVLGAGR
jgi:hypothetical protein